MRLVAGKLSGTTFTNLFFSDPSLV
jgi:hypothetical protein